MVPDLNATCSLAESCNAEEFQKFVADHPDHTVVSYVNTTAATKAVTDVVVTSGNARQIVESFPKDEKIIFAPDKNLGGYINSITGRQMLLWDGACHVHEKFSLEKILDLKKQHPEAKVLVHPECKGPVVRVADKVGSKTFIPAPPDDSTCACNECNYMKLITMQKLYNCLKYEWPQVEVDPEVSVKAVRPINRMLEISARLGL